MSNDNRELKNNELNNKDLPEGVTELSMEDLEQVTGGITIDVKPEETVGLVGPSGTEKTTLIN